MDVMELEALGLYDPGEEHAELRLKLLNYLTELGATADELVEYSDELAALAAVLVIRGGPVMTLEDVSRRSGMDHDDLRRLIRLAGLPDPGPDTRFFTEGFAMLAAQLGAVVEAFGEAAADQLLRVMGSAMARVADAVVSSFLVNIEPTARHEDPVGLGVARANVETAALLPLVAPTLDVLFRQHLLVARRSAQDYQIVGYETQRLVVVFVDLVGSTELGEQLALRDLGVVLSSFEHAAADRITAGGGRVIKLTGDGILYTAPDPVAACTIALKLADTFRDHPLIPPVRAGLAGGEVMLRDGDVYGPVVNLAARAVEVARPGEVVATSDVADAAEVSHEPLGPQRLKGIADEVDLQRLIPKQQPETFSRARGQG